MTWRAVYVKCKSYVCIKVDINVPLIRHNPVFVRFNKSKMSW